MPRGRKPKSPIVTAITEIREYLAQLDREIADKQAEREELQRELAGVSASSASPKRRAETRSKPATTKREGGRMRRATMQTVLENIQKGLTKGEEYTRQQVASAAKVPAENVQSVLLRAKAKKILKSNGQRGPGGRWLLA